MHVEYWICDGCNKEIDHNEKTKYTTTEMGYPFIPKSGGGKHFHYLCLIEYYKKKKLPPKEIAELVEDAERRHEAHISKKLKKGGLTKNKLTTRKATKKDRDELFNYFYGYYGLKAATKKLNSFVDSLNSGEEYGEIRDIQIPYFQLKDMLVYYRKDLDKAYSNKNKKDGYINALSRIFYDIAIVINNLDDYCNRREVKYNQINNNKIDGGEELRDFSQALQGFDKKRQKESKEKFKKLESMEKFIEEELLSDLE
jgi:hypothetical protein